MTIRIMRVREARRDDEAGRLLGEVADAVGGMLPEGATFGLVVLLPGGRGHYAGSKDLAVIRRALEAIEAAVRGGDGR